MLPPMYLNLPSVQKNIMKLCVALTVIVLISGCATLNEGDCREGDWASIGYNDAIAGLRGNSQLRGHNKACSRYQVSPDNQTYFSGYSRGLKQFCTQSGGARFGSSRTEYIGTCPKPLERSFLAGYLPNIGLAIDNIQDEIDDMRHQQRKKSRKLDQLQKGKQGKKGGGKSLKKLEENIEDLQSSISSKRSDRNKLRAWYSTWSLQLN